MDEAIDAVLRGEKLYPSRSSFIASDLPSTGRNIAESRHDGYTAVLVFPDGGTHLIRPTLHGRIRALLHRNRYGLSENRRTSRAGAWRR
jgi:hypothetical protein